MSKKEVDHRQDYLRYLLLSKAKKEKKNNH